MTLLMSLITLNHLFIFILCIWCSAYMSIYVARVFSAYGNQKRASDPMDLELQMVVIPHDCWLVNQGFMQEHQGLLTSESSSI